MSEIKRNLPNEKYKAAINSTATGADPNAPLSAITNSDLEATLTRGDTTADGQVIKAENGGGQLNLRDGADDAVALTTDNGSYGTPYAYIAPDFTQLTSVDGGLFFTTSDKSVKLYQKNGLDFLGIHINADTASGGGLGLVQGLYILNNSLNLQSVGLSATPTAVVINADATVNAGVEASVVLGGVNTIAKTSYTAYVRQLGFHEAGTIEGLLNNRTLTEDQAWWLQDESGEIPVGPGWNTLVANPTATEDGFVLSWNQTSGEYELVALPAAGVTGSGAAAQVAYFDSVTGITSEAGFEYDAAGNKMSTANLDVNGTSDLDGAVVVNESGADVDFRIESDTNPNLFQTDGANSNVNIGGAGDATNKLYVLVNELSKQSGCAVDILSSVSVYGVRAEVSNAVDTTITGLFGSSKGSAVGTTNRGVAGDAVFAFGSIQNYGVFGRAGDASQQNIGVYGLDISGGATSTLSAGLYGSSQGNSPENNGAYGHVSGGGAATLRSYALRGFNQTSKDNATNYGLHAVVSLMSGTTGTTNYAAYLDSVSVDPATHYGLVVASAINSGFNVTAPTAILHVDGSVRLDGLTTTPAAGYVLQATDANGNADWQAPTVSQVKSTSVTKIANYTAVNGDFVIMTTGVSNKTVFLPLTPANDEIVEVYKEDSGAGNLILDGNGETIQLLGSVAATQTITAQGESFTAQYIGTKWVIK
jgi:hypothetical protein